MKYTDRVYGEFEIITEPVILDIVNSPQLPR